jgi:hypothetical protein
VEIAKIQSTEASNAIEGIVICSLKGRQGNSKREWNQRWENGSKWI